MENKAVKVIECPRDAMQGIVPFIPTELKIEYINALLKVGFDSIDFGSFVSPKAIPQMRDTAEVLAGLDLTGSRSKLLAIIANERGAEEACAHTAIDQVGYPFSISETFQQRNTNTSIEGAFDRVKRIAEICANTNKELVIYISMAFGNPYGDPWSPELVLLWTERLADGLGVRTLALADTLGNAHAVHMDALFRTIIPSFPEITFGAHLHARPDGLNEKVIAALEGGCRRFDTAIRGFGGCPMANDHLVGNADTEAVIRCLDLFGFPHGLDMDALKSCVEISGRVFPG
jgi:hydroxymethylglutaryl-CoA lyase